LGIYAVGCKSAHNRDACTPVFITALFKVIKLWNQPSCLSTDEWIKKMWYVYLAMKKNGITLFAAKWVELEIIMLSEIIQTQKDKYCMFSIMCEVYI
jgi:hypothetical protein